MVFRVKLHSLLHQNWTQSCAFMVAAGSRKVIWLNFKSVMIEVSCTEESSVLKTKLQDKNFKTKLPKPGWSPHLCPHLQLWCYLLAMLLMWFENKEDRSLVVLSKLKHFNKCWVGFHVWHWGSPEELSFGFQSSPKSAPMCKDSTSSIRGVYVPSRRTLMCCFMRCWPCCNHQWIKFWKWSLL